MRLIPKGTSGQHENYTAINFDNKSWYDEDSIGSKKFFSPQVKDYIIEETERKIELETDWGYLLFAGDTQVYEFHSYYRFGVIGIENPIVEQDLKNAIQTSHNEFKNAFDEKRKEHRMFKPTANLSEEMIQKILLQLSEVLLPLLTS